MNKTYGILYDTEHFCNVFYSNDKDAAIESALNVLTSWMESERANWDPAGPTSEQIDAWNYMIDTTTVFVYEEAPGRIEPEEEDIIWDMNDEDLRKIGWKKVK